MQHRHKLANKIPIFKDLKYCHLKKIFTLILIIGLFLSIYWYIDEGGNEPLIAILGALAALVYIFIDPNIIPLSQSKEFSKRNLKTEIKSLNKRIVESYKQGVTYEKFIAPNFIIPSPEGEKIGGIEEVLIHLEEQNSRAVVFVLGEFGTGKSWALRNLEFRLAQNYLKKKKKNNFPIFSNLRELDDIDQGIDAILLNAAKAKLPEIQNNIPTNAIFLLDSLDEASRTNGLDKFEQFLNKIKNYSTENKGCKIVIACRRSFFKEINKASYLIHSDPSTDISTIIIKKWETQQVSGFIKLHDSLPENLMLFVEKHKEITSRPLVLNLLIENWVKMQDLLDGNALDEYTLFDKIIYVTIYGWANKFAVVPETVQERLHSFIKLLAVSFLDNRSMQKIERVKLQQKLHKRFKDYNYKKLGLILRQTKTRSIIEMTEDGKYYQFCHRSIWEFIISKLIIKSIESLSSRGKGSKEEKKLFQLVLQKVRSSPELYISMANQFVIPILKQQKRLDILDKHLPKITLSKDHENDG